MFEKVMMMMMRRMMMMMMMMMMMEVKVLAVAVKMTLKDNEVFRKAPAGHKSIIK